MHGLRICFIAGTLGQGGAERQLYYILKSLKDCGAKVSLLSLTNGEFWEEPIRQLGVPIFPLGDKRSRIRRLWRVLEAVRRLRPQVVQCQHFYTSIYGAVAGRCLGIPAVGAVRNDGCSELKANGPFFGRLSLIWPNWVVANSERAIRNLRSLGFNSEKFLLLPNVVDTGVFRSVTPSRSKDEFVILGVGSLVPAKRFDRLFEIVSELRGRINRFIRVVIAGDGPKCKEIAALAEQTRKIGVIVDLAGRVADPLSLYQTADVLLHPSDWEGTPNVIMEAMACGLPVVATNVGGIPDLVKNGETGFLFDPSDHTSAVASLERLVREPGLAQEIGQRARTFIEEHYSVERSPELLAQLYATVLHGRIRTTDH